MTVPAPAVAGHRLVLLNPQAAGGRAAQLAEPLRAALATRTGPATPLAVPASVAESLACLDALPRGSRVVLVGGDGTLNRLLPALHRGGHTLALVGAGSGNDSARALGVRGWPLARALDLGLDGPARPLDLGEARWQPAGEAPLPVPGTPVPAAISGAGRTEVPRSADAAPGHGARRHLFMSSLTAGFDSAVGWRAQRGPRALRGLPRYLLATARELAALRNWPLRVWADGQLLHDGPLLFASTLNTPTYASGMPCVPAARLDDGRLDALLAGPLGRLGTLAVLPLLLAGWHLHHPRVRCRGFAELRIESPRPLPLAADGEYLGDCQALTVTVRPGALAAVRAPGPGG